MRDPLSLRDAFFNPTPLSEVGIEPILKYLASTRGQEIDTKVVDDVRNFLFGAPGQGGFDLAALNIQRGRDHGIADYNTVRAAYGLPRRSHRLGRSRRPRCRSSRKAFPTSPASLAGRHPFGLRRVEATGFPSPSERADPC